MNFYNIIFLVGYLLQKKLYFVYNNYPNTLMCQCFDINSIHPIHF